MAFMDDSLHDALLDELDAVTTLHICSAEPTSRANAISLSLGSKSSPGIGAKGNSTTPAGRKRTVSAITDGTVSADGTASHWALIDGTRLIAANSLASSKSVANGGTFTLDAFDIVVEDATSL